MNVIYLLIGMFMGSFATLYFIKEVEKRRVKALMHGPVLTALSAAPVEPPPKPGYIPFEIWPPPTGWHRVLITREPHDGDTVQIGLVTVTTARLAKINAPELPSAEGKASQQALAGQLTIGQLYTVWLYGRDKYGRTLAEFYNTQGNSINQWLVTNGFASPYAG
jgi:hypothetical protein